MTSLRYGAATDVGLVRPNNQDDYLADEALFAVADGMGGAAGGEIASRTAVAALKATFDGDPSANGLADGVRNANRAVWDKARERPDLRGMGTTMTAVALVEDGGEDVLAVVNVGDSRVYLLRDGVLDQLTDDHSVPEELLRAGRLTPDEAARHPQRNVLTRVLGVDEEVEVDCFRVTPYKGDRLVLASDGLYNEVDDDDIASMVRREADPQAAAHGLVERARAGGGADNITVVVVDVVDDDDRAVRASAAVGAAGPSRTAAGGGGREQSTEREQPARAWAPAGPGVAADHRRTPPPPSTASQRRDASEPRFTLRVAAFSLAVVLVLAGAGVAVAFFARAGYFVGAEGGEVVIYKGRPGGLLWLEPTVVERTGVRLSELRPARVQDVRAGKEESSVAEARRYVDNVRAEATTTTTTTTTTTAPVPPPAPAAGTPVPTTAAP